MIKTIPSELFKKNNFESLNLCLINKKDKNQANNFYSNEIF